MCAAGAQASGDARQVSGDGQAATPAPPLMLSTDVESKGWFRKLFGINFRYHVESQVEPNAFYVLRTNKVDEQGKRVRTSEAVFDQDAKRVVHRLTRDRADFGPDDAGHIVSRDVGLTSHRSQDG